MKEERKQILEMLANGKITPEDAEKLLDAIKESNASDPQSSLKSGSKKIPKYLIVSVKENEDETGKHKNVNIRVPFQLIHAGVKLASLIPEDAKEKIDEALNKKGMEFSIDTLLQSDNLQEILDALADMSIDVNDGKSIVKIGCE